MIGCGGVMVVALAMTMTPVNRTIEKAKERKSVTMTKLPGQTKRSESSKYENV